MTQETPNNPKGQSMESRQKAGLAMTAEDHLAMGSTPLQVLIDNPGKTWIETMSDAELREFIMKQVADTTEQYERAKTGDKFESRVLEIQLSNFLAPNIAYLREIGRLPTELADLDPAKKFAL